MFTDDPVRDAEIASRDTRDYITCYGCGGNIYLQDDSYDGDTYYDVYGEIICEECMSRMLDDWRVK